jgi:hypothetical protein
MVRQGARHATCSESIFLTSQWRPTNMLWPHNSFSAREPDELYDKVDDGERAKHASQGMEFMVNQAYTSAPNIPMEPNQCYHKSFRAQS